MIGIQAFWLVAFLPLLKFPVVSALSSGSLSRGGIIPRPAISKPFGFRAYGWRESAFIPGSPFPDRAGCGATIALRSDVPALLDALEAGAKLFEPVYAPSPRLLL